MKNLISIVITGEVDHGKSSLVGKILEETGAISQSRIETVKKLCAKNGKEYEPAFLLDAFEEEQSQGITIDVSQFNFATATRQFRFIDSPGHRDFLKNMVSGSSAADSAILLIDAKEGIREQSRRHCYLLKLLGIDTILVVVNKMDLQAYKEAPFRKICEEHEKFLKELGLKALYFIPVSAKFGVNTSQRTQEMPWYTGPTFLEALDSLPDPNSSSAGPLRFPVQDVYKFDERRIIAGRIESGRLEVGSELRVWPSGAQLKVATIEKWNAPSVSSASTGESIGITLVEQGFVERGNIIGPATEQMPVSDSFEATLFWMGKEQLKVGAKLRIKLLTQESACEVLAIHGIIDTSSLKTNHESRGHLNRNDVGLVTIKTSHPIALDPFKKVRESGRFVLSLNNMVCGGGIVSMLMRRQSDRFTSEKQELAPQHLPSESPFRSLMKAASWRVSGLVSTIVLIKLFTGNTKAALEVGTLEALIKIGLFFIHERIWNKISLGKEEPRPVVLWFTGLPCSGKSTIAERICKALKASGNRVEYLDGDAVRSIFPTNGFSREERKLHIERIGFLASRLAANGTFVVASLVSPFEESREFVRKICPSFVEVYVSTPLEVCEKRDVKGMYAKARRNEISNFTGVSDPYDVPKNPEIEIDTSQKTIEECEKVILQYLMKLDPNIFKGSV